MSWLGERKQQIIEPEQPILRWEELDNAARMAIKALSLSSFEAFIRIWFQLIQGQYFKKNWHHTYECQLAERIYYGDISRGIVNVAPGSTKTEIWSIHWPAWCIAKCIEENRPSRWLPLSYSDDLVTENASRVKEILDSEEFRTLWPLTLSNTIKGKSDWKYYDQHGNAHRMYGTSINGQVTGRRAGFMVPGFTGALILDDPMPPKDQLSGKVMEKNNKQLNRVVRSRLAKDDVPIIMVQQRIGKGDSTEFLMSGKAPDDYELFKVPALIDREYLDTLPEDMREAAIKDTGFTGKRCSYWVDKEPTTTLLAMEKADAYMFSSQYQQDPNEALAEGVIYRKEIETLIEDGRYLSIPVEKYLPVFTFWDIGINDHMVVWLMQPHRMELRLIACYGNNNEGIEHYINWLLDFADKHGIRYAKHLGPHDLKVRDVMTKRDRVSIAKSMGIKFTTVERCKSKRESINALKVLFPRIYMDNARCEKGWEAFKALRREWDPENEAFTDSVGPKWATNYTDALQQMGLHWKDAYTPGNENSSNQNQSTITGAPSADGWMRS